MIIQTKHTHDDLSKGIAVSQLFFSYEKNAMIFYPNLTLHVWQTKIIIIIKKGRLFYRNCVIKGSAECKFWSNQII